jgi:hypothetical protein
MMSGMLWFCHIRLGHRNILFSLCFTAIGLYAFLASFIRITYSPPQCHLSIVNDPQIYREKYKLLKYSLRHYVYNPINSSLLCINISFRTFLIISYILRLEMKKSWYRHKPRVIC